MALTVEQVQESILDLLESKFIQPVFEIAVPDADTLQRDPLGQVIDYLAVQFGDIQVSDRGSTSFIGPRYDDYVQPFYVQTISSSAKTSRRLMNKVNDVFLGSEHPFSSLTRKRFGGGVWPIIGSNQATEAYLYSVSFGVSFQAEIEDLPVPDPEP